jgi:O-antigen ligase
VYWSFAFRFSPHNHYFSLWFNTGLVGLFCGSYLLFSAINRARRASLVADPQLRRYLVGFAIGVIAVCGAVFFVELHKPWMFFWMYAGTVMRLVLCVEPEAVTRPVLERRPLRQSSTVRDSHGWLGRRTS